MQNWLLPLYNHVRELRRHHRPLALVQMPALEVQADDVVDRVVALIVAGQDARRRPPPRYSALQIAVAAFASL